MLFTDPFAVLKYKDEFEIPEALRPFAVQSAWQEDGVTPSEWAITVVPKAVVDKALQRQIIITDALIATIESKAS